MIVFVPKSARGEVEGLLEAGAAVGDHPTYSIPGLTVDELVDLFAGGLEPAETLFTGRTTDMQPALGGFALFHELTGAIYGTQDDGEITALYFDNRLCDCDHDFSGLMRGMHGLATRYDLVLVDWWLDLLVTLDTLDAVRDYVEEI
jgi:hypothetical protein